MGQHDSVPRRFAPLNTRGTHRCSRVLSTHGYSLQYVHLPHRVGQLRREGVGLAQPKEREYLCIGQAALQRAALRCNVRLHVVLHCDVVVTCGGVVL
jgi:hypothetical protein